MNSFRKLFVYPAQILDRLGMYRVVTIALLFLVACAFGASLFGQISYSIPELMVSLGAGVVSGMLLNWFFAKVQGVHMNHESALITSLILFFLIVPAQWSSLEYTFIIVMAAAFAMLSKYLLVWRRQHILNPVAAGVVAVAGTYALVPLPPGYFETGWWIGQPIFFIPLLLAGAAVVAKVRKWTPVLSFLSIGFLVFLFEEWRFSGDLENWSLFWLSGPSLFLAAFMLTEPFTMPPTKRTQSFYGAVVGALSQTTVFAPFLKMTPELALLIGNLAVYPFRIRRKLFLQLVERRLIAADTYELIFNRPDDFTFQPGQYLEWMLPHQAADSRGIRRYFTIASSPTESKVRLALKVVPEGSSYKQRILELDEGDTIIASQLAGDFLLPKKAGAKLGFIAGGIGVTPFRSHIRYMIDSGNMFDTTLLYCSNTVAELAYLEDFELASERMTLRTIPVIAKEEVSSPLEHGFVTREMLERRVPDFRERTWYLSGPPPMVNAYTSLLLEAGVSKRNIIRDFFPGLA